MGGKNKHIHVLRIRNNTRNLSEDRCGLEIGDFGRRPSVLVGRDRYIFHANRKGITLHPTLGFSRLINTFNVRLLNKALQPIICRNICKIDSYHSSCTIRRENYLTAIDHCDNCDMYYYLNFNFKLADQHELLGQKLFLEITGNTRSYEILGHIVIQPQQVLILVPFTLRSKLKPSLDYKTLISDEKKNISKKYCSPLLIMSSFFDFHVV